MNNFFCADCNTQLNSKMQWDQHLTGGKHMRAVALHNKAPGDGISNQSPGTGSRTLSPDMSHAAPDPDGVTFRCKVCPEFECKGPIPMRAHLVGVKHLKALQRQQGLLGTPSRASTPFPALEELSTPIVAMMSLPASCDEDLGGVSGSTPKSDPLIVLLPDGRYKCTACDNTIICGPIPMEQHLKGKQHLKNVRNFKFESVGASGSVSRSPPNATSQTPSCDVDMSCAILRPDGKYSCTVCDSFSCTGVIPMREHLLGKSHQKALLRNPCAPSPQPRKLSFECVNSAPPSAPVAPEERLERTKLHPIKCGYTANDAFSNLPLKAKINALNPHFAFIGHNENVPNLLAFLIK